MIDTGFHFPTPVVGEREFTHCQKQRCPKCGGCPTDTGTARCTGNTTVQRGGTMQVWCSNTRTYGNHVVRAAR
jgi:hypothetical protein